MAKKAVKTAKKCEEYAGPKYKGMKIETPYPKDHKKEQPPFHRDIEFLGKALADMSDRVNEVELSISDLASKIKRVMGRMGL